MLGQFYACMYIHRSCVEVVSFFLDFRFQDFRRSVQDLGTVGDPLIHSYTYVHACMGKPVAIIWLAMYI